MVEQAPLKRKVASSSLAWPTLIAACFSLVFSADSPAAKTPEILEVPKGTVLSVELVDGVTSGKNKVGDSFRARISDGVYVHSRLAVPPGVTLRGLVTQSVPSGRVSGRASLSITLQTIEMDGRSYSVKTDTLAYVGEPHLGQHLGSWLGGALQGALYGVLFGGKQGAIIGSAAGGAAGTAGSIIQGKSDIEFSQGSKLMFETQEPFQVPAPPAQAPPTKESSEPKKPAT